MHPLAFIASDTDLTAAYSGHYNPLLVTVSVLMAIVAAYTAFSHVKLIHWAPTAFSRRLWHLNGAFTMGAGVWAMHFSAMLAFELPVPVAYHPGLTLLSVLPALLAGWVILNVVGQTHPGWRSILSGGVLMGLGIGTMHYTGMAAMTMPAEMVYRPGLFALSFVTAVTLATLALALAIGPFLSGLLPRELSAKLLSSVVMGLAVTAMHYVAMAATVYLPTAGDADAFVARGLTPGSISLATLMFVGFILLTSTLLVQMRRQVQSSEWQTQESRAREKALYDKLTKIASRVPGLVFQFQRRPDGSYCFPYVSEAINDIFRVSPQSVAHDARPALAMTHPDDYRDLVLSIERSAEFMSGWQHQYRVRDSDGGERWLMGNALPERGEDGSILWHGVITDITEQKMASATIENLAYFDVLTGLPNRRLLQDRIDRALAASARNGQYGALLFIDLDGFKRLNDMQGHASGDLLLKQVSERLVELLRNQDTISRLGGDEFVVCIEKLSLENAEASVLAERVARKLMAALNRPFDLAGFEYLCAASIGVSMFDGSEAGGEALLKQADIAMYQAKNSGSNVLRFFDPGMHQAMEERFQLENELRVALAEHQFELFLQNQVDTQGRLMGAEALIRWRHPTRGLVSPGLFIPLAEDTGLIIPIGQWVLESACEQLWRWQQHKGTRALTLSINVSARQFYQPDFTELVRTALLNTGIDPTRLKLELTESLVLQDLDDSLAKVEALRSLGVRFAMDDFGTGYSSLSYLSKLPFDEVKIDKSFIQSVHTDHQQRDWVIVEAIISIGRNLGMDVVAEGVETEAQTRQLQASECYVFQGFLFGYPVPAKRWRHDWRIPVLG